MTPVRLRIALCGGLLLSPVSTTADPTSVVTLQNDSLAFTVHLQGTTLTGMRPPGMTGDWLDTQGHFLCFDRWGPITAEEKAQGIPFHGEARRMSWSLQEASAHTAHLKTSLPVTRFTINRHIALAPTDGAFHIINVIANPTESRRSYNLVEHITLGAPWQQPAVTFATNAKRGILHNRPNSQPDIPFNWPRVQVDDRDVDLRTHAMFEGPVIYSLVFEAEAPWGWICLRNQETSELLGYLWRTADFPWLNIYSKTEAGKFVRFAIEPGTTSVHAVMAEVISRPPRLGRSVVNWLEAGDTRQLALRGFTTKIPPQAGDISDVTLENDHVRISFADGTAPILIPLPADSLPTEPPQTTS
ncbi:MAG: hypothetical protein H7A44_03170 [Opitutaceae bacterium]|nr:hypothetical protein [Cephaloticoccus sp.]MCP5529418.1 hypothetical protein [Opitutaceae bacterium]